MATRTYELYVCILLFCCFQIRANLETESMTRVQFEPVKSFILSSIHTFSDPLNVLGNATLEQRGKRQWKEGVQPLLQLHCWNVCEMLSLPVWREVPSSTKETVSLWWCYSAMIYLFLKVWNEWHSRSLLRIFRKSF